LKTDKLLKWYSSAGKQFHGLTTLSAKKLFVHINTAVAREEFGAWPLVLWLLLAKVKKSSGFMAVRPKTILCENQIMLLLIFRLDALALSVIATATWLAGWLSGCLSQPVLYQID